MCLTELSRRRDLQVRRQKRVVASNGPSNASSNGRNRRSSANDRENGAGNARRSLSADRSSGLPSPDSGAEGQRAADAQEDWLTNNLQAWYQAVVDEPVPAHLSALARQLDEALATVVDSETGDREPGRRESDDEESRTGEPEQQKIGRTSDSDT